MDMKRKTKIILCAIAAVLMLAGCGKEEPEDDMQAGQLFGESIVLESGQVGNILTDSQGNAADTASHSDTYMDIPEGQITEQSFRITLDGWGEVTFASFWPEQDMFQKNGIWMYGDARFMLLKDGKAVYTFPEMYEDNGMSGQQFGQVVSVAFRDYNEDDRMDVLLILEYAGVQGIDIGTAWMEVRAYAQKEEGKEFYLDSVVSDYINRNTAWGDSLTMEDVVRKLEGYAGCYSAATDHSAWEVERFAGDVRKEILSGDFEGLAQKIAFPIVIGGSVYANQEEFLSADFVAAPDRAFLDAIEQAPTQNLFCNWQGIMLGNGEVWFAGVSGGTGGSSGSQLKIIAVNGISGSQDGRADAAGYGQQGSQGTSEDYWRLQEAALSERMEYYRKSEYYQEIVDYWENVRGATDVSNRTDFLFATDSRYYIAEDFQEEPSLVIHLAKNEIYARHGYIFDDPDLYNYFMGCIWYMPTTAPKDFDASVLNEYEKENVKVLAGLDDL